LWLSRVLDVFGFWNFFGGGGTAVWTQGFAHAKQALYHLSHASSLGLFWKDGGRFVIEDIVRGKTTVEDTVNGKVQK
jgi:hypothetical protein